MDLHSLLMLAAAVSAIWFICRPDNKVEEKVEELVELPADEIKSEV